MPGRACVQVVREVVGEHPAVGVGEHEVAFDRFEQPPPRRASRIGRDLKRVQRERRPAPGGLRERGLRRTAALGRKLAFDDTDADEEERDRELGGKPLEVVCDVACVTAVHVQEVDVVDDDQPGRAAQDHVSRAVSELRGRPALPARVIVEATQRGVEAAHRRARRQPDERDRDPVMTSRGRRAMQLDLLAVMLHAVGDRDRGLPQARVRRQHRRAAYPVAVLAV